MYDSGASPHTQNFEKEKEREDINFAVLSATTATVIVININKGVPHTPPTPSTLAPLPFDIEKERNMFVIMVYY